VWKNALGAATGGITAANQKGARKGRRRRAGSRHKVRKGRDAANGGGTPVGLEGASPRLEARGLTSDLSVPLNGGSSILLLDRWQGGESGRFNSIWEGDSITRQGLQDNK
jgi:hypothetical protein